MEFSREDISMLEVSSKAGKKELDLLKIERQKLRTELADQMIRRTQVECSLMVKTDLRKSIQTKINAKRTNYAKLEKRAIQAETKNKILKQHLSIITSRNDQLKKMIHAAVLENDESSGANKLLKKQLDDYQNFKRNMCANKNSTEESISKFKSQLKNLKDKNKALINIQSEIPDSKFHQEIEKLKGFILKEADDKQILRKEVCHLKELDEQLKKVIEENPEDTQDKATYYHKMVVSSWEHCRSVVDAQTEYNQLSEELRRKVKEF